MCPHRSIKLTYHTYHGITNTKLIVSTFDARSRAVCVTPCGVTGAVDQSEDRIIIQPIRVQDRHSHTWSEQGDYKAVKLVSG